MSFVLKIINKKIKRKLVKKAKKPKLFKNKNLKMTNKCLIIGVIASIIIFDVNYIKASEANKNEPKGIKSESAVVIDSESGRVLFEKNAYEKRPMASTTKIMTLIVALENGDLNKKVKVSKRASQAPNVQMHIKEGEEILLRDLLYPLMLESSNDCAIAVAEGVAGSVEDFATLMNKKAKEIGANNTNFVNPNGLDSDEHYSTAYDMALIANYGLKNSEFVKIINTKSYSFKTDTASYSVNNKNRLLNSYQGGNGFKTGYTNKASNCFVGGAKKGDTQLISTVLCAGWGKVGREAKWTDTYKLLDYGFNNYKTQTIMDKEIKVGTIKVNNSKTEGVNVYTKGNVKYPIKDGELEKITIKADYEKEIDAPFSKDTKVGEATIMLDENVITKLDILTSESAEIFDFISVLENVANQWINIFYNNEEKLDLRKYLE